jgi:hypothetical protein
MIPQENPFENLPAGTRIAAGLADRAAGRTGINACLVRIAAPRLSKAGYLEPSAIPDITAELDLYEILMTEPGNPYGRYNALIRELISFEHALDSQQSTNAHS